ncbi:hypothetical protein D3C85_1540870 [compost metagenome]
MHFGNGFIVIFLHDIHHAIDFHFPTLGAFFDQSGIGTEFAVIYTDIRRLNVKITVKEGMISMTFLTDIIGENTKIA